MSLFSLPKTGTAERHAVIKRTVIANFGRLPNNHAHAVIDKNPTTDFGPRMNFNAGQPTGCLRNNTSRCFPALNPTPMGETVNHHGVKTGIGKNHFPFRVSGRIFFLDRSYQFTGVTHLCHRFSTLPLQC
ncbi:hypothetical protein EVA_08723 [gut metagenome]|uniref:Uncharacterized protein n=1 Tax=gut metagenome TaxID=749906 RepID=J9GSG4_9ZZZZ